MRLTIDHRTRYSFSEPQTRIIQLLRVKPQDHAGQAVTDWRIDISHDCRLREGLDGFGNITTMLYVDGPVTDLETTVQGEVLTEERGGWVAGVADPLPALLFTRPTSLTAVDPAIAALAAEAPTPEALNQLVGRRVGLVPGRPLLGHTAATTLADGIGTARDIVHVFLAAARAAGHAARFVSGHCLACTDGPNPAPHSWAEVMIDGKGWMAFDPSFGAIADAGYVRVAAGLDANDATPVAGARDGGGEELLDVALDVEIAGENAQN